MKQKQHKREDGENQCQRLLALTDDFRLFRSMEGVPFLKIQENDRPAPYPVKSERTKRILASIFLQEYGQIPDGKNIEKVMDILSFHAEDKPKEDVFVRVARHEDKLYIDLGDDHLTYIEVNANDWSLKRSTPPVNFLRPQTMKALPIPTRGGDIKSLRRFLNLSSEKDFNLLLAYLVGALFYGRQYPIAIFQGPQGSAKSTTTEIIKELVDPGSPSLRSIPSKEEDIFIAAKNAQLLCFDNLSGIPPKISDTLCKIATGGSISGRRLYSNDDEYFIQLSRPIIINGIDDLTDRPDLADRAIVFNLQKIDEASRQSTSKLWADFQKEKAGYFGRLLDALVMALRDRESIVITKKPRMVDFCLTACAGLQAFGYTIEETLAAFLGNRQEVAIDVLTANPVGRIIAHFMANKTYWRGTAEEVLLDARTNNYDMYSFLPSGTRFPSQFAKELRRIAPSLKLQGIDLIDDRTANKRAIILQKMASYPSLTHQIALTSNSNDTNDATDMTFSQKSEA